MRRGQATQTVVCIYIYIYIGGKLVSYLGNKGHLFISLCYIEKATINHSNGKTILILRVFPPLPYYYIFRPK